MSKLTLDPAKLLGFRLELASNEGLKMGTKGGSAVGLKMGDKGGPQPTT